MSERDEKGLKTIFRLIKIILTVLLIYLLMKLAPLYLTFFAILWNVITPFLIAVFIAYLLHPVIEKLHKHDIPRWLAVLGIYLLFFGGIGFALYKAFPTFVNQSQDLITNIPAFVETYRGWVNELYVQTSFLPESFHDKMDVVFNNMESYGDGMIDGLGSKLTGLFGLVIGLAVIPVLVFYFLKDYSTMKELVWKLTPKKYRDRGKRLLADIDKSLGGYIRGQLLVIFFVGLISFGLLWFIGMKYPLLLGLFMGVTELVPYFGPFLGAIPAIIIAFTISYKMVIYVVIVILVVQIIEGNLLSPYIVGKSVHIHPALIIFALLIGGEFGGVFGMIVAVPILTVIKVLVEHSKFYTSDR